MFTGIVQKVAEVASVQHKGASSVVALEMAGLAADVKAGDSVMADGVCLTATGVRGSVAEFDVSAETLRLTTLGSLRHGSRLNVELAMRPDDRFGGHFVSGHVDGVGTIERITPLPGETRLRVRVPKELSEQMVMKGSVAVDGISLTVAALEAGAFEVSLIPHTLAATTLSEKKPGARVNVECDMIGKWVLRLLGEGGTAGHAPRRIRL
jgi:riboflavin synthase